MEKNIKVEDKEYLLEKNVREAFDLEEFKKKNTDFFDEYAFIVGDWAYGKLRLKGFYEESNKKVKEYNNIKYLDKYLQKNCAFGCKYFVLKRVYKK